MEDPTTIAAREMVIQAVKECIDPDVLNLVYKLLCFL